MAGRPPRTKPSKKMQRAAALRRIMGLSFKTIGQILGVSRQRAHQLVTEFDRLTSENN
jgi:plasmid maintenance system antidote protein VapI